MGFRFRGLDFRKERGGGLLGRDGWMREAFVPPTPPLCIPPWKARLQQGRREAVHTLHGAVRHKPG